MEGSGWLLNVNVLTLVTVASTPKVHPGGSGKVKMGWEEWERERGIEQQQPKK